MEAPNLQMSDSDGSRFAGPDPHVSSVMTAHSVEDATAAPVTLLCFACFVARHAVVP